FLQPHADESGLPASLDLHLAHQLAPGLLGGQAGDDLELAALLLDGCLEPRFLLAEGLLASGNAPVARAQVAHPPVQLVEFPGALFLLGEAPALHRGDLLLAAARLPLELGADLELVLLDLKLGGLETRVGLALRHFHDAARRLLGIPEASIDEDFV